MARDISSNEDISSNALQSEEGTELASGLQKYRARRLQRYLAVNVLLMYWIDPDITAVRDADLLGKVFSESFNYQVHRRQIPVVDSQRWLGDELKQFLSTCGGTNNLIVMHYVGHGYNNDNECHWARQYTGGPTLNWTTLQDGLLSAVKCDLVFFLDCCFAGTAVRSHSNHMVEFLAATDDSQYTPDGSVNGHHSFTQVLAREVESCLKNGGKVSLPDLSRRMCTKEARLTRQPFYLALTENSAGKILLKKFVVMSDRDMVPVSEGFQTAQKYHLEILTFRQLSSTSLQAFLKWLTTDSPSEIRDVRLINLLEADAIGKLGERLIEATEDKNSELALLSKSSVAEITALLEHLQDAVTSPAPSELRDDEAREIHRKIVERSFALVRAVEDCIGGFGAKTLGELQKWDLPKVDSLKSRIAIRLKLLGIDEPSHSSSVSFETPSQSDESFRVGRQGDTEVIVEYHDYGDFDDRKAQLARQVARISALHSEPKPPSFRSMVGRGYLYESLYGERYGFIFEIPAGKSGHEFISLSELIKEGQRVPLDYRIRLASILCEALVNLHSVGWLHKSIQSKNILLFAREASVSSGSSRLPPHVKYDFEEPYLVGFSCSRPTEAGTRASEDVRMKNNIYRHPERWGKNPLRFERYHDLYSLGILLVEIGRWKLLPEMKINSRGTMPESVQKSDVLKDFLLGSNMAAVKHAAGLQYANAVRVCLEDRHWVGLEEWQYQKVVRNEVLKQMQINFGAKEKEDHYLR